MKKRIKKYLICGVTLLLFWCYSIPFSAQDPSTEIIELNNPEINLSDFQDNMIPDYDYSITRLSQIGNDNVSHLKQKGHFNEI